MNTSNLIVKTRITEAWQSLQLQAGKAEMHSEWKIRNLKPKYVKKHTLNESRDRMFTGVQVSQNPCFCRECKIVGGIPQFFPKVGGIPQFFPKIDLPIYRDLNEYQIPAMTESLRGFTSEHIKQEDLMAVYRASYVLCHKENVASESLQFWLKNTPINEIYEDEFKDSELEMFEKLALLTLDIIVHNKARGYVNKELLKKNKDGLSTIYFDPNTTGLFIFIMSILIKNTFKTTPDIKHTINEICSDLFAMKEFNRSSSQENKSTTRTLNSFVTDKKIILEKLVDIYFDKKRGSFYRKNYDDIFKIINSEKTINNEGTINDMLIASTAALNVHDQSIVAFFLIQCIRYVFEKILTEKPVQMAIESGDPEQFPSLTNQWLENISIKVSSKMEKKCHDKLAKDEGRVNARLVAEEQFKYATSKPPERIAEKDQHQKNVSIGLFMGIMPRLKQKDIESLLSALETIFVPRVDLFKENQSTNFKEWKTARCKINLYMQDDNVFLLKGILKLTPWHSLAKANQVLTEYTCLSKDDAYYNKSIITFNDEKICKLFDKLPDNEKMPPYIDACKHLKENLGYGGSKLCIHILIWKLVGDIDWVMQEIYSRSCPVLAKTNEKDVSQSPEVSGLQVNPETVEGLTSQMVSEAQKKQGAIPKRRTTSI